MRSLRVPLVRKTRQGHNQQLVNSQKQYRLGNIMRLLLHQANREQGELWDIEALHGMKVLRDEGYLIILPRHLKSRSKMGRAVSLTR